jgi:antitoxin component YwqK of YwqJK toxin-antitoxin module
MKTWYKNGAIRMKGSMHEKDTVSRYNPADSSILFTGFFKVNYKGWYENGKLKFETVNKNGLLLYNYYNEQGILTRQEFICGVSPDGFDTISQKIVDESNGKKYAKELVSHISSSSGLLLCGDD